MLEVWANELLANVSISRRSEAVYAKMDNVPMDPPDHHKNDPDLHAGGAVFLLNKTKAEQNSMCRVQQ